MGIQQNQQKMLIGLFKPITKNWTFQHFTTWSWFVETCYTRERYLECNVETSNWLAL
jgi:hypothetical protein